MKKIIAAAAATGLLLIGAAAPASAETLYRNGANKVTIKPVGAPAGAEVTKAKVTVKKGKKTVARNKSFYKAKKGKYKVTSTFTYFPTFTRPMTYDDQTSVYCNITSRAVIADQTTWVAYESDPSEGRVTGPATIQYTGTCRVDFYPTAAWSGTQTVTYPTTWTEDEAVFETSVPQAHDRAAVILAGDYDREGQWMYAYSPLGSYPTLTFRSSPWETTSKSTRTVVVK